MHLGAQAKGRRIVEAEDAFKSAEIESYNALWGAKVPYNA